MQEHITAMSGCTRVKTGKYQAPDYNLTQHHDSQRTESRPEDRITASSIPDKPKPVDLIIPKQQDPGALKPALAPCSLSSKPHMREAISRNSFPCTREPDSKAID